MKIFFICLIMVLASSCMSARDTKRIEESNKKTDQLIRDWIAKNGCLAGALEMKKKYYLKMGKDIPKEIRLDMVDYCMNLKDTIVETNNTVSN